MVQHDAIFYHTAEYHIILHNIIPLVRSARSAMQYYTIQYHTIQYYTTQKTAISYDVTISAAHHSAPGEKRAQHNTILYNINKNRIQYTILYNILSLVSHRDTQTYNF